MCMEPQRSRIANPIFLKKNKDKGNMRPQNILQNDSNQDNVVLASKQTYRPMEQTRESRSKTTY